MNRFSPLTFPIALIALLSLLLFTGCPGADIPGPEDDENGTVAVEVDEVDPTVFQQADEFEFLVDFMPLYEAAGPMTGMDSKDDEEETDEPEPFEQLEIMAEANDSMVHAHGSYRLTPPDELKEEMEDFDPFEFLGDLGTADVNVAAMFSEDTCFAYLFAANPDSMARTFYEMVKEEASYDMSEREWNIMLQVIAGDVEESALFDWVGDEMCLFLLNNPDFDPDAEPAEPDPKSGDVDEDDMILGILDNLPFFPLLVLKSDNPSGALDFLEEAGNNAMVLMGTDMELNRTEIDGYDALEIPVDEIGDEMGFYMESEEAAFYAAVPSLIVAVGDYLIAGTDRAMELALDSFEENPAESDREATAEFALDLDRALLVAVYAMEAMFGGHAGEFVAEMMEEIGELHEEASGDLGTGRIGIIVTDEEHFDLDILAGREYIAVVKKIIDEFNDEMPGDESDDDENGSLDDDDGDDDDDDDDNGDLDDDGDDDVKDGDDDD